MPERARAEQSAIVQILEEIHASAVLKSLMILGILMIALTIFVLVVGIVDRFREPYIVTAAKVLTPQPIHASSEIMVQYDIDRRRLCKTELVRFFSVLPEDSVVHRETVPGGTTSIGRHTIKNTVKLPPEIKPGMCYRYNVQVVSECSAGTQFTYPVPTVEFCTTN
jgi:hypothetical protein